MSSEDSEEAQTSEVMFEHVDLVEISEQEFIKMLKERTAIAKKIGSKDVYQGSQSLMKTYRNWKKLEARGTKLKFYYDKLNGGLKINYFTKTEVEVREREKPPYSWLT